MTTLPQTTPMRAQRPGAALTIPAPVGSPILAQPSPVSAMSGNDVVRVLRAASLWIILSVVVGGIGGYGVNTWLTRNFPRYNATGMLRIMTPADYPHPGEYYANGATPRNVDLEAKEQITKIYHGDLPTEVLTDSDPVRSTQWFKQFIKIINGRPVPDVEAAKQSLLDHLDVSLVPESRLLAVTFNCSSPDDCSTIVTAVCEQHIKDQQQTSDSLQKQQSALLASTKQQYLGDYNEAQDRVNSLMKQLSAMGEPVQGRGVIEDQLSELTREKADAHRRLSDFEGQKELFEREVAKTGKESSIEDSIVVNPLYLDVQSKIENQTRALSDATDRLGERNDHVLQLRRDLLSLQTQQQTLHDELREVGIRRLRDQIDQQLATAQHQAADMDKQVNELQEKIARLATLQNEFARASSDLKEKTDKLNKINNDIENNIIWNSQGNATVTMYTKPETPDRPTFPKLSNSLSVGIGFGLALALGIAFLRELTDTSVRSPRDIARVGQLNLLGMIPHQDDDPQAQGASLPMLIMESPHSMISEQFRQVRTRLQHAASLDTTRSILVTGCSPGDGKTTVACNLSAGLALNGRRILLVDANFRRPQLHQIFNLENKIGFGDVLTSPGSFVDAIHESSVPNLSILPIGNKPMNSTELLESQLLIDFIERALEEFDHVIFDSGPLLIVSETVGLAPRVDGVVTVVRAVGNSRGILQRLRDQLRQIKAEHLGVILNAVRVQGGGYYGPLIKTYYAYQDAPLPPITRNGTAATAATGATGTSGTNGQSTGYANGHTNGTNGYANGHTNGANGHTNGTNGYTNGQSNGHSNGYSNGNGHSNGHSNGNGNGTNGAGTNGTGTTMSLTGLTTDLPPADSSNGHGNVAPPAGGLTSLGGTAPYTNGHNGTNGHNNGNGQSNGHSNGHSSGNGTPSDDDDTDHGPSSVN